EDLALAPRAERFHDQISSDPSWGLIPLPALDAGGLRDGRRGTEIRRLVPLREAREPQDPVQPHLRTDPLAQRRQQRGVLDAERLRGRIVVVKVTVFPTLQQGKQSVVLPLGLRGRFARVPGARAGRELGGRGGVGIVDLHGKLPCADRAGQEWSPY